MRILLTGGTGFVGSHILMKLLSRGHSVDVVARNPGKIPALSGLSGVRLIEANMAETGRFEQLAEGHDACIHVALSFDPASAGGTVLGDTFASVALAEACARRGVGHFIYTSSTAANDVVYKTDAVRLGGKRISVVDATTKQEPASYYGATKAATENFLNAISWETGMRVNIVRPGFVFGEPAIEGAPVYSDRRFPELFARAREGSEIRVTRKDGTQFIWAGDLAEVYARVLEAGVNRAMYFGLSENFVSWERIATEAIRAGGAKAKLVVEERGWGDPLMFDVSDIKRDLGLAFDPWERLLAHVTWGISTT